VAIDSQGHPLAPDREFFAALKLDGAILGKVLRIGLPTGVQMVVLSLSELVILALVNQHGSQATAAYGAVTQIVNYVQFPALSIAITASILGAQAIGAGRIERMGPILKHRVDDQRLFDRWSDRAGLLVVALVAGRVPHRRIDPLAMAEHLLHIMLWSLLVFGFQAIIGGIMRASGTVLVPVAIAIICVVGVQLPAAYCWMRGWFAGRVDGVSGGVSGHAGVADAVLQTGVAASEDRAVGVGAGVTAGCLLKSIEALDG
jgi:Na+-driven multidrug efflux pump